MRHRGGAVLLVVFGAVDLYLWAMSAHKLRQEAGARALLVKLVRPFFF